MLDANLRDEDLIIGGRSIAAFFGKPLPWLRRQRERSKCPPPVWRSPTGGELVARRSELLAWIEMRRGRR